MEPRKVKRFNDATIAEVNGMKRKGVIQYTTHNQRPSQRNKDLPEQGKLDIKNQLGHLCEDEMQNMLWRTQI